MVLVNITVKKIADEQVELEKFAIESIECGYLIMQLAAMYLEMS